MRAAFSSYFGAHIPYVRNKKKIVDQNTSRIKAKGIMHACKAMDTSLVLFLCVSQVASNKHKHNTSSPCAACIWQVASTYYLFALHVNDSL